MQSAMAGVAAFGILPVEVLMKSAPAAMASMDARRTGSYPPSSPVSRMTLRWASPQASFEAATSSWTLERSPERKAERFRTMSISSAPSATALRMSSVRTSMSERPLGKAPATLATATPVPATAAVAWVTISG